MKMQDAQFEKREPSYNPFAVQLDAPMQKVEAAGVCEMKPYLGDDARWYSTRPEG